MQKPNPYNNAYTFAGDFFSTAQTDKHNGNIVQGMPIFEVTCDYIVFSALKKSENGDGLVLRMYNVSNSEQTVKISLKPNMFSSIYETNLAENVCEPLVSNKDTVLFSIPTKKIKTIMFKES